MSVSVLVLAVYLGSAPAQADAAPTAAVQSSPPPAAPAASAPSRGWLDGHRLHLSFSANATGYLSDTRTMGGVGFSVGVRDVFRRHFLIEADASYLFMIGNVVALRGGFGVQRSGFWSPAAIAEVSVLLGDRFSFLQPGRALPLGTPTAALGLTLAPLRFQTGPAIVSVLQVGVGLGTEFTNWGPLISADLIEIAVPL